MILKTASSVLFGSRPKSDGISKSTLILLRSEKPSTYHRSAEAKPATSRSGGWRRWDMVRISVETCSTRWTLSEIALSRSRIELFGLGLYRADVHADRREYLPHAIVKLTGE